ncbi:uncharacterized protein LOC106158621 [Lingula anatina]|uniref:Uncharacterized protein LOC106158621 n=1 Tax=Lingula anatina TaxID=7574 RepID=A0A1S3HVU3_LINAN|nr:uncharacterized protein LOC106158621 [Lingula anatina]|eukprot:XP_013390138.1 uncharacterized protein LOC106158621 [Lingula anatina]
MIGAYGHESAGLKELLQKYAAELNGKSGIVIGTQHPWVEVMLLNVGVNHVTTVDYNTITIEHPNISVISVTNLAEKNLDGRFQPADFAVSFSSIEHAGLGRYGDPVNPYGDLESAAQTWCMLKPGGLFFLGVPANFGKRKGKIRFNGDRVYGEARLEHLTANFLELERRPFGYDGIITLRKPLSD